MYLFGRKARAVYPWSAPLWSRSEGVRRGSDSLTDVIATRRWGLTSASEVRYLASPHAPGSGRPGAPYHSKRQQSRRRRRWPAVKPAVKRQTNASCPFSFLSFRLDQSLQPQKCVSRGERDRARATRLRCGGAIARCRLPWLTAPLSDLLFAERSAVYARMRWWRQRQGRYSEPVGCDIKFTRLSFDMRSPCAHGGKNHQA